MAMAAGPAARVFHELMATPQAKKHSLKSFARQRAAPLVG
jgi:hypothetical protein